MKRCLPLALHALLAVLILAAAGCKQPVKPMRFNNMIARGNQKLSEAAKKFYKAVSPLSKGTPADVTAARGAYNEMQTTLSDLQQEFADIRPPVNSPYGEELLDKYRSFLKTEQTIFNDCIKPAWDAVQRGNGWDVVQPLLAKANELERTALSTLQNAQADYTKHHNLEPKS